MNKIELSVKDGSFAFVGAYLFSAIFVFIVGVIGLSMANAAGIATDDFMQFLDSPYGYILVALATELPFLAIFLFYKSKRNFVVTSKFSLVKLLIYIFIAVVAYFALTPIVTLSNIALQKCGFTLTSIPYEINTEAFYLSIISLVIVPAICEELLFRGVIVSSFKKFGKFFCVLISAVMFTLFHTSIEQLILPLLMGILLGAVMCKENNVVYTIAIHAVNNFLSLVCVYFNLSLYFSHWGYIILAFALLILFVVAVCLFIKRIPSNKSKMNKNEKCILTLSVILMLIIWIIVNIYNIL